MAGFTIFPHIFRMLQVLLLRLNQLPARPEVRLLTRSSNAAALPSSISASNTAVRRAKARYLLPQVPASRVATGSSAPANGQRLELPLTVSTSAGKPCRLHYLLPCRHEQAIRFARPLHHPRRSSRSGSSPSPEGRPAKTEPESSSSRRTNPSLHREYCESRLLRPRWKMAARPRL